MSSGGSDHRATRVKASEPPPQGLDRLVHDARGWCRRPPWLLSSLERRAARIQERTVSLERLAPEQLGSRLAQTAREFRRHTRIDDSLNIEGLALVAVVARRVLGLSARTVQLTGALALQHGYLIEMATGEGKSLTAALGAALFGWTGRPCHVLTVNDYLAARDAEEMRGFYAACGLTATCVTGPMRAAERREAYLAGIVYTTAAELLADFLRDRLELGDLVNADRRLIRSMAGGPAAAPGDVVLRGIDTVLVDEADSVLIDEAITPLLISIPTTDRPRVAAAKQAVALAKELVPGQDYLLDRRHHEVSILPAGIAKIDEAAADLGGVWKGDLRRQELVMQVLTAREFHRRDQQYVVHEGKVVIVDDFTGRLMPERSWSHGVHQVVEALEGVEVTSPTETLAQLSFQRFFRLFRRVCGMTGTAREVASELWHIYELPVVPIPTHAPGRRQVLSDRAFPDEASKLQAVVDDVARWHAMGRPVLCGSRRLQSSERLAERLAARGLPFRLLNAVRHREEAAIVAEAGRRGTITIATNMAGRGTDIKLEPAVREMGGLHVVIVERNESARVDRQLAGRGARQGDPGSVQTYYAPDDELLRRFAPAWIRSGVASAVARGLPGGAMLARAAADRAQAEAQALAYRQRIGVMRMDEWLEDALSFAAPRNLG